MINKLLYLPHIYTATCKVSYFFANKNTVYNFSYKKRIIPHIRHFKAYTQIPSRTTGKLQMSFKDIIFVVAIIMNRYEKVFLIPIMPDGSNILACPKLADILPIRPCVSTISLPEMQPNKRYAWTDCLVSLLGRKEASLV